MPSNRKEIEIMETYKLVISGRSLLVSGGIILGIYLYGKYQYYKACDRWIEVVMKKPKPNYYGTIEAKKLAKELEKVMKERA